MMRRIQSLRSQVVRPLLGIALGLCATFVFLAWQAPAANAGNCTFASTEASNNWNLAANWSCHGVPTSTSPVIIPTATTTNMHGESLFGSLTIQGTGTVRAWGNTVHAYGNLYLTGNFKAGTSTMDFTDTATQVLNAGGTSSTFYNVTITKASGTLTANKNINIGGTLVTSAAGTFNIATSTLAVTGVATIGSGTTVTSTTGTMNFTDVVTNAGSMGTVSGKVLFSSSSTNSGTLNLAAGIATSTGNFTNTGTMNQNTGRFALVAGFYGSGSGNAGTGTTVFYGTADQSIRGINFYNVEVRKTSGTATIATSDAAILGTLVTYGGGTLSSAAKNITVTGTTTLGAGTTVTSTSGTLTFTGAVTNAGSIGSVSGNKLFSSTLNNTSGILDIGSGYTTTTGRITAAGTINGNSGTLVIGSTLATGGTFNGGTGTVAFAGTSQNVPHGYTYYNLNIRPSDAIAVTTTGTLVVTGSLTVATSRTFNLQANNMTVTGATINLGTTTSTTATMTFTGAVTNSGNLGSVSGKTVFSSTLNNSGLFSAGRGVATSTGSVTNTGTINAHGARYALYADYSGAGTFAPGTGLVVLYGTAAQSIRGVNFYDVEVRKVSGTATITTAAATIGGTLTTYAAGTLSAADQNLTVTGVTTIAANSTVTSTSGTLTFTGAVTNAGSIGSVSGNKLFSSTLNNTGVLNVGSGYTTTTDRIIAFGTINGNTGDLVIMKAMTPGGTFNKGTGTVTFAGSWQTVPSSYSFYSLAIRPSDTASVTTTGAISLAGGLVVGHEDATFNLATSTFTVAGSSISWGTVTSTSGNLTFNGSLNNSGYMGSGTGTLLFSALTNRGILHLPTNSTSTGNVAVDSGTIFLHGHLMSVGGNWINAGGILSPGTGTVRLYGSGTQNVSSEANFYNLTIQNTGTVTLTGNVTSTGAFNVTTGSKLAVSTYTFKPSGASYTNNGLITVGTGGKIVYLLDSAALVDSGGSGVTTLTNPGLVFVKVQDKDANLNGAAIDTITARVTNNAAAGSDTELMTLVETGNATGIFMNTTLYPLVASGSIVHDNGQLEISAGGVGTMNYANAYDTTDTGSDTVTITLTGTSPSGGTSTGGGGGGGGGIPSTATTYQSSASDADRPKNLANLAKQGVNIHALVKLPDDGKVSTQEDSAVYYIGADGKRHAFPNSKVFFTWYPDFSKVVVITADQMASIPLGKNVIYKPGSRMVKFLSLNDTYVVTTGGTLRWVKTEAVASALYGANWNKMIDDIDDTFFNSYKIGDPINAASDIDLAGIKASANTVSDSLGL